MYRENNFSQVYFSIKRVLSIAKERHLVKKVLTMYRKRFYLNGSVIHKKILSVFETVSNVYINSKN